MDSILETVSLVLSSFVDWLSLLTNYLITNPIIQLVFAFPIIYTILYFIISLILSIFNNKNNNNKSNYSDDPADNPEDYLWSGQYEKDEWDYKSTHY